MAGGHFSSLLAAGRRPGPRVPVTVLTGFLGSGKTTLLNRLLRRPGLQGTVVIVNEFGEIGLDHELIAHTAEDTVLLANGCLCCAVRGDLIEALAGLAQRMGPALRQVLIETSGLADPAPILRVLMGDPAVTRDFALRGVACTVDAVLGGSTLDGFPEAARQAAVADLLVLTKTDLAPPGDGPEPLLRRLRALNPEAGIVRAPDDPVDALLEMARPAPGGAGADGSPPAYRPPRPSRAADAADAGVAAAGGGEGGDAREGGEGGAPRHAQGIASFVLVREEPLPREAFAHWLDMVVASRGTDLLRVKGLVRIAEEPDRPLVVHGVQHLFAPVERLEAWPSDDTRSRLVFITRGLDAQALSETLDILVRRHARRAPA